MTRVIVDPSTVSQLHGLVPVEICDPTGELLGYFYPVSAPGTIKSPISDEEIERRRQQRDGKPLAEIAEELNTKRGLLFQRL